MSEIRREILAVRVAELKIRWDRLTEKLKRLIAERDRETCAAEKRQLDLMVAETQQDRDEVEVELRGKERELETMTEKHTGPIEVFYSYAHEDGKLRARLNTHLSLLERQGVISGWHDRRLGAGQEFDREIKAHLESANIVLLLVSADFMASDYIHGVEIKRAMERHESGDARVIPVILRPYDWTSAPFGKLVALPTDGKPVTSWANRDEAFSDIARGIRAAAEYLTAEHRP